jgi:hypothetical protein
LRLSLIRGVIPLIGKLNCVGKSPSLNSDVQGGYHAAADYFDLNSYHARCLSRVIAIQGPLNRSWFNSFFADLSSWRSHQSRDVDRAPMGTIRVKAHQAASVTDRQLINRRAAADRHERFQMFPRSMPGSSARVLA